MRKIIEYFNNVAHGYESKSGTGFWGVLRRKEEKAVMQALTPVSGLACIEMGCGSGYYTNLISKYSPSFLVAVDISSKMLFHLKTQNAKKVKADIQNIRFHRQFDRILCAGALEFLPTIQPFLSNVKCLLTDEGKMVLLLPRRGLTGLFYKGFHRFHGIKINLFGADDFMAVLEQEGWKLEKIVSPTPMTYIATVVHAY